MSNRDIPAGTPPPGVTPNFDHPSGALYPEIAATVTMAIVLTTFFTTARLIAKRAVTKFNIEDYLSIITWLFCLGYSVTFMYEAVLGSGRHIWDVRLESLPRIKQLDWTLELLYCVAIWFAKVTLLLQLQRTFAPTKSGAAYVVCQLLIWINLLFYLISFFTTLMQCVPQSRIWNPLVTTGSCIDMCILILTTGAMNVVSDLAMFIMPMWIIWHLHLDIRRKIGISAVFATGLLAVTSSILRLVYSTNPLAGADITYLVAPTWLWSIAEMSSIILCTCFPLMPRFLKVVTGKHSREQNPSPPTSEKSPTFRNQDGNSSTYSSNVISTKTCEDCTRGLPCIIHDRDSQIFVGRDIDEECLYVFKTVSYDVVKHKAVSF